MSGLPSGFSVHPVVLLQSSLEFPFSQRQAELRHQAGQGRISPCGAGSIVSHTLIRHNLRSNTISHSFSLCITVALNVIFTHIRCSTLICFWEKQPIGTVAAYIYWTWKQSQEEAQNVFFAHFNSDTFQLSEDKNTLGIGNNMESSVSPAHKTCRSFVSHRNYLRKDHHFWHIGRDHHYLELIRLPAFLPPGGVFCPKLQFSAISPFVPYTQGH